VRIRDAEADVVVVHRVLAFPGGSGGPRSLFWSFSIVRVSWCLGMRQLRRVLLCLGSGRSRQEPNVVLTPRTAGRNNAAGFEGRISAETNRRFVLHVHERDTSTLSPEFP